LNDDDDDVDEPVERLLVCRYRSVGAATDTAVAAAIVVVLHDEDPSSYTPGSSSSNARSNTLSFTPPCDTSASVTPKLDRNDALDRLQLRADASTAGKSDEPFSHRNGAYSDHDPRPEQFSALRSSSDADHGAARAADAETSADRPQSK
jgi:hypothetical protein